MHPPIRSALRNPVAQFLAAGLLAAVAVTVATSVLSGRAARDEAVRDARARTELLARQVVQPLLPRGLVHARAGAVDRFDRALRARGLELDVARLKVWRRDGTILYSDQTQLIGQRYALGDEEVAVLDGGATNAEISDLSRPENRFERDSGGLLEVYTRVQTPEGVPVLFEAYYALDALHDRQHEIATAFRPIALGGLVALLVLTTPLVWLLWQRLQRASRERERLLLAAVEASDVERRRIARDLHDGVVQDLTATAFGLSAAAAGGDSSQELAEAGDAVRRALRSLRSLLVEIYPPDLHSDGLSGALDDLLARAHAAGVEVTLLMDDLTGVPDGHIALVWRAAQEAVRNSLRHASPAHLGVEVQRTPDAVVLTVTDDGTGFDPASLAPGRLGLRGLRDLATESGATLTVRSSPGAGAEIQLSVGLP